MVSTDSGYPHLTHFSLLCSRCSGALQGASSPDTRFPSEIACRPLPVRERGRNNRRTSQTRLLATPSAPLAALAGEGRSRERD